MKWAIDQRRLGLLKILLHTNAITVSVPESEHASVLLCDPTYHSIIPLTTTVSCCACSAPPR